MKKLLFLLAFLWLAMPLEAKDPLSALLKDELARNMNGMAGEEIKPYFMSYRVNEIKNYRIRSSFGQLMESTPDHSRKLSVHVRVGSHELDNTHTLRGSRYGIMITDTGKDLPLDNNPDGHQADTMARNRQKFHPGQ
jgi:TldD protein